jgi:hypothetical protein
MASHVSTQTPPVTLHESQAFVGVVVGQCGGRTQHVPGMFSEQGWCGKVSCAQREPVGHDPFD